jgi:hypothetical protein
MSACISAWLIFYPRAIFPELLDRFRWTLDTGGLRALNFVRRVAFRFIGLLVI